MFGNKKLKAELINRNSIEFIEDGSFCPPSVVNITTIEKTINEVEEYVASIAYAHGELFKDYKEPDMIILPRSWFVIIKKYNEHMRDENFDVIYTMCGALKLAVCMEDENNKFYFAKESI